MPRPLGHVLTRRIEAYHDLVREPEGDNGDEARTIHSDMEALEPGLTGLITEDGWRRCLFTDLLLPPEADVDLWAAGDASIASFQESASRWWQSVRGSGTTVEAVLERSGAVVHKTLSMDPEAGSIEMESVLEGGEPGGLFGVELCLNMLTATASDRFLCLDGGRRRLLGESGRLSAEAAVVADLWRDVSVDVHLGEPVDFWFAPLWSVSRSERGYEKVFQGSALMPVKPVEEDGGCRISLSMRIGAAGG